jgi:hypothetical protein
MPGAQMISGPENDPHIMRFGQDGAEPAANGVALTPLGLASQPCIPSDSCCLTDLLDQLYSVGEADREALDLAGGWARRWTAKWKIAGTEVICPSRTCQPFRHVGVRLYVAFPGAQPSGTVRVWRA